MTALRSLGPARVLGAVLLLGGPTVLAFASGGFFDSGRLWAAILACALVVLVAVTAPRPLPAFAGGRLALGGLAGLTLLTGLSALWATSVGPALDDSQRLLAYLAGLLAGAALLRHRPLARAVEPAIALGGLIVVGYGLAERVLPGVIDLTHTRSAAGRLDQPLTYWNAMGALAAIALTACVRLAGDDTRSPRLRAAAAAASPLLAAGLYLTFSRGALAAVAVGLGLLIALTPTVSQARATALCLAVGLLAMLAAGLVPGLRDYEESIGTRETGGALFGVALALLAAGAAMAQARLARAGRDVERAGRRDLPRRVVILGLLAVLVAAGSAVAITTAEHRPAPEGASAARLASVESNRYSYWRVALESFADAPLVGHGSGSFRYEWRLRRDIAEAVRDAHSLYLETASELGLAGLLALGAFLAGVAACAVRVGRRDRALAAGPTAVAGVWVGACALDWHWEMPAVTLPALLAVAVLLARAETGSGGGPEPAAAPGALPDDPSHPVEGHPGQHHDRDLGGMPEAR